MKDPYIEENDSNEESELNIPLETEEEYSDDDEEKELPPPEEENEAKQPAMGNIIGLIILIIAAILIIAFIAINVNGKDKDKNQNEELDKAGVKTIIEFKDKNPVEYFSSNTELIPSVEKSEKQIDETLEQLPMELQLPKQGEIGTAPVTPVGSKSNTSQSDRPDTRNSKSTRKIEGLASLDYSKQQNNQYTVSQMMYGNYGKNEYGQNLSKEDFIARQMAQTQSLQNSLAGYGFGNNTPGNGNTTGNKESFFSNSMTETGNGEFLNPATLWDGTIISGALVTAINTDNPGVVIARVTENVYSSKDHSYLLIPEGTLLMATYNSSISYGQNRVQVAWNLMIRPDNYRMQLGNMNGVSPQGASGYKGYVSEHPFKTLAGLGMVAVYSIIQTEVSKDIDTQNNEYLKNSLTDVYSEASKIGNKIVDRALDIKPTITIKSGTEIKLITNTPLELPPVEMFSPNQKYIRKNK